MTTQSASSAALVVDVRAALRGAAEPEKAAAMQAYMKSALPFYGVARPRLVAALRPVWAAHPVTGRASWEADVRALWDGAEHREERYAALGLLAARAGRPWHDPDLVPLLEHLVVTGAWWDLVDDLAGHHVGPTLRGHRGEVTPVIRRWAVADDLWLRRTAVLCQLGARDAVDRDLLVEVIAANAGSAEFFLRKAIGWALRDLAHHDPAWVRAYLDTAGDTLSPLSRREAARHL